MGNIRPHDESSATNTVDERSNRRLELRRPGDSATESAPAGATRLDAQYKILENAVELFVYYDSRLHIVWANKTAGLSAGRDQRELVGKLCHRVWHEADQPCADCPVHRALATGESCDFEQVWADGRVWHIRATPVAGADDSVEGVAVFGYEITEQRRAMQALEASELRYRQVIEAVPLFLFAADPDGKIETYNTAARDFLGKSMEGSRSCFLFHFTHPSERERAAAAWNDAIRTGQRLRLEVRLRRSSDGEMRWHEVKAAPVKDDGGRIVRWFGVAVDIHERREIEEALLDTNRMLNDEKLALEDKNVALREIMNHVREQDKNVKGNLQANIDRWLLPLLRKIEPHCDPLGVTYLSMLRENLTEIVSPFQSRLASLQASLTPRETEICHMIRNGMNSKEMAAAFNVSVNTVFNQRRSIRRKLRISGADANLATFLMALSDG